MSVEVSGELDNGNWLDRVKVLEEHLTGHCFLEVLHEEPLLKLLFFNRSASATTELLESAIGKFPWGLGSHRHALRHSHHHS